MIKEEQIRQWVEEKAQELGLFIVTVEIQPSNKIRIEVDSLEGIKMDECVQVSRHVEHQLDRDKEDFSLEVMSPGLGNPFKVHAQYTKNVGKEISVTTVDGIKYEGTLTEVTNDRIKVIWTAKERIEGTKKKQLVQHEKQVSMSEIKTAKNMIKF